MKTVKDSHHRGHHRLKTSAPGAATRAKLQRKQRSQRKVDDGSSKLLSSSNVSSADVKKHRRKRRKWARSNNTGGAVSAADSSNARGSSAATVTDEIASESKPLAVDAPRKEKKRRRKKTQSEKHQITQSSNSGPIENEVVKKKTARRRKRRKALSSETADSNVVSKPTAETAEFGKQLKDQNPEVGNVKTDKKKRKSRKRRQGRVSTTGTELDPADSKETAEGAAVEGCSLEPAKKRARHSKMPSAPLSSTEVRRRALEVLKVAQFRLLNEDLYTTTGTEANKKFREDPQAFESYHEGFEKQVAKWPSNPVDVLLGSLKKLPKSAVIADMGCGDAKIAQTLTANTVHSFDLVARNDHVTQCNMSKVPLQDNSVNVVVFSLSLMGTNLNSFILEANRILKQQGTLKIAEVESRFDDVDRFVKVMKEYGFSLVNQDSTNKMFILFEFKKAKDVKRSPNLPIIRLKPCLYKKR